MVAIVASDVAHVRCLARLHTLRRESGLPPSLDVEIPSEGMTALALVKHIVLPIELVEGAFVTRP